MIFYNKLTTPLETENKFSRYSAIFRVAICIYLLKDIILSFRYIDIIYQGTSFYSAPPTYVLEFFGLSSSIVRENIYLFLSAYILIIIFFMFGIGKYLTAFLLFFFLETQQRLCYVILNGGDNLLKFIVLYLAFIDSYEYLSLRKMRLRTTSIIKIKNLFSNLGGLSICIHLCLVYFLSAIHKIHTDVWFNGVATYYTLSLERFKGTSLNDYLSRNGTFVTISTYFTLAVELFYPVLIWFRQTRAFILICALFLHLGIYVFMMIYDFQIIFIFVQGFFIGNAFWGNLISKIKRILNSIKIFKPQNKTTPETVT